MPAANSESIERQDPKSRSDTLALLYQGVFTGIVRLQAGRQKLADPVTFRRRIREALEDVRKEASAAGYSTREIRDAESAVVAFLDEAVLSLQHPARDKWASQPLFVELYGDANAGDVFYERLEDLRGQTDSAHLADLLEVFLLCLLLGFEGRYSGPTRAEGQLIADRLRSRIEAIRGGNNRLSPPLRFLETRTPAAQPPRDDTSWRWWLIGSACTPLLLFVFFKLNLAWRLSDFMAALPGVK